MLQPRTSSEILQSLCKRRGLVFQSGEIWLLATRRSDALGPGQKTTGQERP